MKQKLRSMRVAVVTLAAAMAFPTLSYAATTAHVKRDADGNYTQYEYNALSDSYDSYKLNNQTGARMYLKYKDSGALAAFVDDQNGYYVDFLKISDQYDQIKSQHPEYKPADTVKAVYDYQANAPVGDRLKSVDVTQVKSDGTTGAKIAVDSQGKATNVVVAVESVSLNKASTTLTVGDAETLIATVKPDNASNKVVNWSSSAPGVASVDGNGKVTGLSQGTANIIATTLDGGKTAACTVTVEAESQPTDGFTWRVTKGVAPMGKTTLYVTVDGVNNATDAENYSVTFQGVVTLAWADNAGAFRGFVTEGLTDAEYISGIRVENLNTGSEPDPEPSIPEYDMATTRLIKGVAPLGKMTLYVGLTGVNNEADAQRYTVMCGSVALTWAENAQAYRGFIAADETNTAEDFLNDVIVTPSQSY